MTAYANDCSLGDEYCYKNEDLEDLNVNPRVNFLPLDGNSSLGVSQRAKNWSGSWYKFVGGKNGALKIEFIGNPDNEFRVPYLTRDFSGNYALGYFQLDGAQRGKIIVSGFGTEISSVVIMPSVQTKMSGFTDNESEIPFFFEATTITDSSELEKEQSNTPGNYLQRPISEMSMGELLSKISQLEQLLLQLRSQLTSLDQQSGIVAGDNNVECGVLSSMSIGVRSNEVQCLQAFLKSQGSEIYPEGLTTGYFGNLTKSAVVRFQEMYRGEILDPLGLSSGTGFIGSSTLAKINSMRGY